MTNKRGISRFSRSLFQDIYNLRYLLNLNTSNQYGGNHIGKTYSAAVKIWVELTHMALIGLS